MKQMKEDLKNGKLSNEDKEKLAKQMEQMKDALKQGVQDAKEAREKLQQEIEKKLEEGNIAEAAKLQQQLDKMNENAEQMEQQMNDLADKLGQVASNERRRPEGCRREARPVGSGPR
jgi:TolA-binding protein